MTAVPPIDSSADASLSDAENISTGTKDSIADPSVSSTMSDMGDKVAGTEPAETDDRHSGSLRATDGIRADMAPVADADDNTSASKNEKPPSRPRSRARGGVRRKGAAASGEITTQVAAAALATTLAEATSVHSRSEAWSEKLAEATSDVTLIDASADATFVEAQAAALVEAPVDAAELVAPSLVSAPKVKRSRQKRKVNPPAVTVAEVTEAAEVAVKPATLQITGLVKKFGRNAAVAGIDLTVKTGAFYGIVGPNGAGKTTTLSMVTGLMRPTAGSISVNGIDVWSHPVAAKRCMGVLPDRLRLFDRLTGAQFLFYSGILRGLTADVTRKRMRDLAVAFGVDDAMNRLVADYSAGMTKKVALAAAMIHSPRLLVLDEPFESIDPVSAANVIEILQKYTAAGGTVVLSSHGMDVIERICDNVAIIVHGKVLAHGSVDEVRGQQTLEERFVELAGGRKVAEGMEWLHSFLD